MYLFTVSVAPADLRRLADRLHAGEWPLTFVPRQRRAKLIALVDALAHGDRYFQFSEFGSRTLGSGARSIAPATATELTLLLDHA